MSTNGLRSNDTQPDVEASRRRKSATDASNRPEVVEFGIVSDCRIFRPTVDRAKAELVRRFSPLTPDWYLGLSILLSEGIELARKIQAEEGTPFVRIAPGAASVRSGKPMLTRADTRVLAVAADLGRTHYEGMNDSTIQPIVTSLLVEIAIAAAVAPLDVPGVAALRRCIDEGS